MVVAVATESLQFRTEGTEGGCRRTDLICRNRSLTLLKFFELNKADEDLLKELVSINWRGRIHVTCGVGGVMVVDIDLYGGAVSHLVGCCRNGDVRN